MNNWTPEEDATLRSAYSSGGLSAAQEALPHRSQMAIMVRAHRLKCHSRRYWTASEDKRLLLGWGGGFGLKALAMRIGRSQWACYERAKTLELRAGCPSGYEHLTAAAKRAGYSPSKLRQILRWYGAPMPKAFSRPATAARANWTHRIVDPQDVDDAVAAWVRA